MKLVNFKMEEEMLKKAKALGINVSKAARQGIESAIKREEQIKTLLKEK